MNDQKQQKEAFEMVIYTNRERFHHPSPPMVSVDQLQQEGLLTQPVWDSFCVCWMLCSHWTWPLLKCKRLLPSTPGTHGCRSSVWFYTVHSHTRRKLNSLPRSQNGFVCWFPFQLLREMDEGHRADPFICTVICREMKIFLKVNWKLSFTMLYEASMINIFFHSKYLLRN